MCSGNFARTSFTNSTKCSEYPLATSRQMAVIFSTSFVAIPQLAITYCSNKDKQIDHGMFKFKTLNFKTYIKHYTVQAWILVSSQTYWSGTKLSFPEISQSCEMLYATCKLRDVILCRKTLHYLPSNYIINIDPCQTMDHS